jgi:hypothetical protein
MLPHTQELTQLALLVELARPLAHECNNFLNNLLLQLLILERRYPQEFGSDWSNLRQAGKDLAKLVQEWQRHRPPAEESEEFDMAELLQRVAEAFATTGGQLRLTVTSAQEPVRVRACANLVERLGLLVLQHAAGVLTEYGPADQCMLLHAGTTPSAVEIGIIPQRPDFAVNLWLAFDRVEEAKAELPPLTVLACKSLLERLQASQRVQQDAEGRWGLMVAIPAG